MEELEGFPGSRVGGSDSRLGVLRDLGVGDVEHRPHGHRAQALGCWAWQ